MKKYIYPQKLLTLAALLVSPYVYGQTITDYSFSGNDLDTITVNGNVLNAGDLVDVTLTGYEDPNATQLLVPTSGSVPGTHASVVEDLNVATGLLNIQEEVFTFNSAIENISGIDLFIFDWGAFNGDDFTVTINGVTTGTITTGSLPAGADFFEETPSSFRRDGKFFTSTSSAGVNTVAGLNSLTFGSGSSSSTGVRSGVIGLDLDFFNIVTGGSVTEIIITDSNTTLDPVLVMGVQAAVIPEPSFYAGLAGAACFLLVFLRRKRS